MDKKFNQLQHTKKVNAPTQNRMHWQCVASCDMPLRNPCTQTWTKCFRNPKHFNKAAFHYPRAHTHPTTSGREDWLVIFSDVKDVCVDGGYLHKTACAYSFVCWLWF